MNVFENLKAAFGPKEPRQEVGTASSPGQPPIHIHMPGTETRRKVPGVAVVAAGMVILLGLVWAGRKSTKTVDPPAPTTPTLTDPASIRGWSKPSAIGPPPPDAAAQANAEYAARMAAQSTRDQQAAASIANGGRDIYGNPTTQQTAPQLTPAQQAAEDRRKKDEESLTASSVIHIVEPAEANQSTVVGNNQAPIANSPATAGTAEAVAVDKTRRDCADVKDADGQTHYAICEGSILPALLENRLAGEFAGPVKAYIRQDIYAADGHHLLIPRGTVALGDAKAVNKTNQKRMEVAFHRLILPGGRGLVLEKMIGLDQAGETALAGKLNRHLLSTFGTAAMIGGLGAMAQSTGGSVYTSGGFGAYQTGIAGQAGQAGQTVLQQGLNRPPEIQIREGKILNIYISEDLHLPEFFGEKQLKLRSAK